MLGRVGLYCDGCRQKLPKNYVCLDARPNLPEFEDCWSWYEGHYGCIHKIKRHNPDGVIFGKLERHKNLTKWKKINNTKAQREFRRTYR